MKTLSLDEILGDSPPSVVIRPWAGWLRKPDALTPASRLAAWQAGRDFTVMDTGQMCSINESRSFQGTHFIDADFGFRYPNAASNADAVYWYPPRLR